jgi:hypothetical protein
LAVAALALGQQDLAFFVSLTAPGLAVSSAFLAADGQDVLAQEAGEQAADFWQDALDPSTAPGLTSACCWEAEQPISSAAVHRTLATKEVFMDLFPLGLGIVIVSAAILAAARGAWRGISGHS